MIYAAGAHTGGYSLFVKDGTLHFAYHYIARQMFRIDDPNDLPGEAIHDAEVATRHGMLKQ